MAPNRRPVSAGASFLPLHSHPLGTHGDASWLSSEGPYNEIARRWCTVDPSIRNRDQKNQGIPWRDQYCCVVVLEVQADETITHVEDLTSVSDLQAHINAISSSSVQGTRRRIYLVEGLNPTFISVLGMHFTIDPSFFARHERTVLWSRHHTLLNDGPIPPSLSSINSFQLKYYEVLDFQPPVDHFSMSCGVTGRHIGVTKIKGKYSSTGVVRRKCSFWYDEKANGGWDVVVLCDPQITCVRKYGKIYPSATEPFQGGYVDFMKILGAKNHPRVGPPRTCMLDDMCFYLQRYGSLIGGLDSPKGVSVILEKLTAAHYFQLIEFVRASFSGREWELSSRGDLSGVEAASVEKQWSDMQALARRCTEYCEDAEAILLVLGYPLENPRPLQQASQSMLPSTETCRDDFQYIYMRLATQKQRADMLNSTITGLASIIGNKQSLREAKTTRALTFIGLLFIPLAYTCSLFSMTERYTPGAHDFWVYFAVSFPLVIVVLLGYNILDKGYNDRAEWSPRTLFSSLWKNMRTQGV